MKKRLFKIVYHFCPLLFLLLITLVACDSKSTLDQTATVVQTITLKIDNEYDYYDYYHQDREYPNRYKVVFDTITIDTTSLPKAYYKLVTKVVVLNDGELDTLQLSSDTGTFKEINDLKCKRYSEANKKLVELVKLRNLDCK
jgi:hypothetical protein